MKNKFLLEKPSRIMMSLLDGSDYIHHISLESSSMYATALLILKDLERDGFVKSEKKGRKHIYRLTEKGRKIALVIKEIWDLTSTDQDKQKKVVSTKESDIPSEEEIE